MEKFYDCKQYADISESAWITRCPLPQGALTPPDLVKSYRFNQYLLLLYRMANEKVVWPASTPVETCGCRLPFYASFSLSVYAARATQ